MERLREAGEAGNSDVVRAQTLLQQPIFNPKFFPNEDERLETLLAIPVNRLSLLIDFFSSRVVIARNLMRKSVDEERILENVVCFSNLRSFWENIAERAKGLINEFNEKKENVALEEHLKFTIDPAAKTRRFTLLDPTKMDYNPGRRLKPELIFEKRLDGFYNLFYPDLRQLHWKVVNGLMAWYFFFVDPLPLVDQKRVAQVLRRVGVRDVRSRQLAIKVFGLLSKLFKLVSEARNFEGFAQEFPSEEFTYLAPEIFIDLDCVFGFSECKRSDNQFWDAEFTSHLLEWLTRDSREFLFGVPLSDEFKQQLEITLSDPKKTFEIYGELEYLIYLEQQVEVGAESREKKQAYMYSGQRANPDINTCQYKSFEEMGCNFFNFAADGSALKSLIDLRESGEFRQFGENQQDKYNEIREKYVNENCTIKKKSVSKTVMFALAGERLPKTVYWVFGPEYEPAFSGHVKKESKKLRHIINADLISFVKQTFVHDWIAESANQITRTKVNSLLNTIERLTLLYKQQSTFFGEKWCVPIDMKDFHQHFGQAHFRAFADAASEIVAASVKSPLLRRDLLHVLATLGDELSRGEVSFMFKNSTEKDLFSGA